MIINRVARVGVIQVIPEKSEADTHTTIMCKECEILESDYLANEMVHNLSILSQHIIVAIKRLIGESGTGKIQRSNMILVFKIGDHLVVIETRIREAVDQHQFRFRFVSPGPIENIYLGSVIVFRSRCPFEIIATLVPVSGQV